MAVESRAGAIALCFFFLLCGTWNSVAGKMLFLTEAPYNAAGDVKDFKKPWYQVWAMFAGMFGCSLIILVKRGLMRARGVQPKPLATGRPLYSVFKTIAIPASCDLIATFLQNVSLVFTNASIWQMLRGSIIIFSAIVRFFYLKKRTKRYEVVGIMFVVLGLCTVGVASVFGASAGADTTTAGEKVLGIGLMMIAQFVQAIQNVVEEELLHDVESDPMFIVACEGFWGVLITSVFFMPLASFLPGTDGDGVHEQVLEDFYMLFHSTKLLAISCLFICVIMVFNVSGMVITQITQATTRNVVDGARTLCVWATMTVLYYAGATQYGEKLQMPGSAIEGGGFLVLIFGMFTYYRVVKLPFPSLYDSEARGLSSPLQERASPAALRAAQAMQPTEVTLDVNFG